MHVNIVFKKVKIQQKTHVHNHSKKRTLINGKKFQAAILTQTKTVQTTTNG